MLGLAAWILLVNRIILVKKVLQINKYFQRRRHCTGKIYLGLIYEMVMHPLMDWLVSFIVLGFLPDDKDTLAVVLESKTGKSSIIFLCMCTTFDNPSCC